MIPARIKESVSSTKVVLLIAAGVLPAAALVASPVLPSWVRLWIWIPIVGLVALLVFGKMDGRPVVERLAAWARFSRRRRRRVWRNKGVGQTGGERVVCGTREPVWPTVWRSVRKVAVYAAVTVGIVMVLGLLSVLTTWLMFGGSGRAEAARPTVVARPVIVSVPTATNTPVPTGTSRPTPTSMATSEPSPTALVWVTEKEWNVAAETGHLLMENVTGESCDVAVSSGAWESRFTLPGGVEARSVLVPYLLLAPVIQAPDFTGVFVVRSTCGLNVEVVAYQPRYMPKSQLWLVPVCSPPGNVVLKLHGGPAEVSLMNTDGSIGETTTVPAGRLTRVPQGEGCWLYWIEGATPVFPEVLVMAGR